MGVKMLIAVGDRLKTNTVTDYEIGIGDGVTTVFPLPKTLNWLDESAVTIKVALATIDSADYSWIKTDKRYTAIQFNTAPANAEVIRASGTYANRDPKECTRPGKIQAIMPDSHEWGRLERLPSYIRLWIDKASVTVADVEKYLQSSGGADPEYRWVYYFDLKPWLLFGESSKGNFTGLTEALAKMLLDDHEIIASDTNPAADLTIAQLKNKLKNRITGESASDEGDSW
jgi:hypothetical protein